MFAPVLAVANRIRRSDLFVVVIRIVGADHLTTTVHAVRGDVMATVYFAGIGIFGDGSSGQGIVGTTHAALGTGFAILLNSHFMLLGVLLAAAFQIGQHGKRIIRIGARIRLAGFIRQRMRALIMQSHQWHGQQQLFFHEIAQRQAIVTGQ